MTKRVLLPALLCAATIVANGASIHTGLLSYWPLDGDLWIGNNPQSSTRMWDGLIDDVAIWDRPLGAADALELYTAGQSGLSLGQIPEPSTGILGALAGLALVIRRRR